MSTTTADVTMPPLTRLFAAVRTAVLAAAVASALLGALTGPVPVTAVGAPLVSAVGVAILHLAAWGLELDRPSSRTVALVAVVGALVVPASFGLPLLGPAGMTLVVALVLVGPVRRPPEAAGSPLGLADPPGRRAGRGGARHG